MIRPGHVVALCALTLLTLGVVMVNSAGMSVAVAKVPGGEVPGITARSVLLSPPTVHMALAAIAMGIAASLPVRRVAIALGGGDEIGASPRPAGSLVPVAAAVFGMLVVLALAYAPGIGKEVNGSHRWLRIPVPGLGDQLSAQPSEIVKWGMVGLIAWYATSRASVLGGFWRGLVPALAVIGIVSAFVAVEDLGTAVLIAASACVVLLAGGAKFWQFAMFVPVGVGAIAVAIIESPYRMNRIMSFIDPYADARGVGYHMLESMKAIANGGGPGRGLGFGLQKMGFLPEDKTDFLFAVICEELGIAGAAVVASLFLLLIWSGFAIIAREPVRLLRLFALGVITTVGLQALINLVVVTGLGPTKGIALPLVSSGGTGWILTGFSLGLVMAIDRTQGRMPVREQAMETVPA
jgi:cell division protein FtsW